MKKVSIIIPVYNMEDCVASGMQCITEQTYENLEIIVIDDGSKDSTYFKCLAEADKDRRIAVFSKNNEGPAAARNLALRKATGDYIYFFDIDDYIEKNTIETLVNVMETKKTDLVACSFSMYDGKKITRTVKKTDAVYSAPKARLDYAEHLLMYGEKGIQGAPWYKLYKREVIADNNIVFPNLRYGEDDVFIARYVECISSFAVISDVLCRYYINTCRRFWDKYRFDMFDTVTKHTQYMLDIVYKWNENNIEVRDRIYDDYFQKTFSSLCCLFNPRMHMRLGARYARVKEITDIFAANIPREGYKLDHRVFFLMREKKYLKVYIRIFLHITRHKFD